MSMKIRVNRAMGINASVNNDKKWKKSTVCLTVCME